MKRLFRLLQWLLKAAVFFTLFAFALNNQQDTRVNFFFGTHWQAPTVLVVLTAFALGVAVGVLGMGILGAPLMGGLQDKGINQDLLTNHSALHAKVAGEPVERMTSNARAMRALSAGARRAAAGAS